MRVRGGLSLLIPGLLAGMVCLAQTATPHAHPQSKTKQGEPIPMPPDRAADSYAIYSLLMPGRIFAGMPRYQSGTWAIANTTVNTPDRNPAVPPQGQLKAPPGNPRGFDEAVGDFERNQYIRVQLEREPFHLKHPFALLSAAQVAQLRAGNGAYGGVTFFSEVYFDSKHQAALVYMNDWCAHLCAEGSWVYLEKHHGQWERQSGIVRPGG